MRFTHKILINIVVIVVILIVFYAYQINERQTAASLTGNSVSEKQIIINELPNKLHANKQIESSVQWVSHKTTHSITKQDEYNVWCIFTKVANNSPMKRKFERFAVSLISQSTVVIKLHLIVDDSSKTLAHEILRSVKKLTNKTFEEFYYKVNNLAEKLQDIISSMQPHFSSQPGSYYSDALFFLSLGLHRIAKGQTRAIMFDADTRILTDIALLFQEFEKFGSSTLFGLAPELSPVYRHILYTYRSKYKNTTFGDPVDKGGFPGVNSGVIMFQFDNIRKSEQYSDLLKPESVRNLSSKYDFKGHLGDQDFYTLIGMEHPIMIHLLGCEWNRQLCTWWKNHGYQDIFDDFFRCEKQIKIFHGNCNTAIPN
ncbi:Xyloside xylosyltransferase 1 [Gryllus bimaculatus]|nr:Xyloside xylosyltransferase 1 [Gryllus bimaculatus]